jgi:membrane-bound serine protease (ClpP class)
MPVLALAVFWFWPLSLALPVYLVILVLSVWLYVLTLRAMHAPAQLGREGMLHESGQVIGVDGEGLRVRVHNEIWNAEAGETLQVGERVQVVGLNGLTLTVRRLDPAPVLVQGLSMADDDAIVQAQCSQSIKRNGASPCGQELQLWVGDHQCPAPAPGAVVWEGLGP